MNDFSNHLPLLSTLIFQIGRQRDMEVMEQRLEEYSAIIHTQEDTIGSMTTPTIAKQWFYSLNHCEVVWFAHLHHLYFRLTLPNLGKLLWW